MREWNVVISVNEHGFKRAFEVLGEFGPVGKTAFFNVLTMRVDDIDALLETLRERQLREPAYLSFLSRLIPVTRSFTFQTPEEFEKNAREAVLAWAPDLKGKRFHVRMHRRGFKGKLLSPEEERLLDGVLLEALEKDGSHGHITFEAPDAVIAVEIIAQRAGLSLWTHKDLQRYPFIRVD